MLLYRFHARRAHATAVGSSALGAGTGTYWLLLCGLYMPSKRYCIRLPHWLAVEIEATTGKFNQPVHAVEFLTARDLLADSALPEPCGALPLPRPLKQLQHEDVNIPVSIFATTLSLTMLFLCADSGMVFSFTGRSASGAARLLLRCGQ